MWKSTLDTHYIIHHGSDLASDLPLKARSRRILWKGLYQGCISAVMIDRSMLRPNCRTKGRVILQVGIIITSLPETDQSLLQDTERRDCFFDCTRADEKDNHDGEIQSAFPDASRWKELVIWHAVTADLSWRQRDLSRCDVKKGLEYNGSERIWDMSWYRRYCFLINSTKQTRSLELHQPLVSSLSSRFLPLITDLMV